MAPITIFLDKVVKVINFILIILLSSLVIVMFASVVWRYFFNLPFSWAEQFTGWTFVWLTYLGAAVAYRRGSHIGVDVVVKKLPDSIRFIVSIVMDLSIGCFLLVFIYYGFVITITTFGQAYGAFELPPSYMYAAGPVSGFLMFLCMIEGLINRFVDFQNTRKGA
ncbi:MAG: hypothetical protein VR72_17695 [Clostridiaceae bacterium BRH_c20a]|nr:MAG: hypothetical protein VR72_17695 [Clostridiaceae bacterium BRH_c20a]